MSLERFSGSDKSAIRKSQVFFSKLNEKSPTANDQKTNTALDIPHSESDNNYDDMYTEIGLDIENASNIQNVTARSEWREP